MPTPVNKILAPPFTKDEILAYLKELKTELEKDGIVELGLFGSYANDYADMFSDIDIVFDTNDEFSEKFSGSDYFAYKNKMRKRLENRFGVDVDIVNAKYIEKDKEKFLRGVIYV